MSRLLSHLVPTIASQLATYMSSSMCMYVHTYVCEGSNGIHHLNCCSPSPLTYVCTELGPDSFWLSSPIACWLASQDCCRLPGEEAVTQQRKKQGKKERGGEEEEEVFLDRSPFSFVSSSFCSSVLSQSNKFYRGISAHHSEIQKHRGIGRPQQWKRYVECKGRKIGTPSWHAKM